MSDTDPRLSPTGSSTRAIRAALASGMGAIHSTRASLVRAGDGRAVVDALRVPEPIASLDPQADFSAALEHAGRSIPALGAV